eukprot:25273-Eustigmatos_ZCMA.PRE.1
MQSSDVKTTETTTPRQCPTRRQAASHVCELFVTLLVTGRGVGARTLHVSDGGWPHGQDGLRSQGLLERSVGSSHVVS